MTDIRKKTVGEIVTNNIRAAVVFEKHDIDFCCGGDELIEKVCLGLNIDFETLEKEIIEAGTSNRFETYQDKWSLDFLIDHILYVHQKYVYDNISLIKEYAKKSSFSIWSKI